MAEAGGVSSSAAPKRAGLVLVSLILVAAGATERDIVGVLAALLPTIGPERVVAATPGLGLALGHDVDEALERRSDLTGPSKGSRRSG